MKSGVARLKAQGPDPGGLSEASIWPGMALLLVEEREDSLDFHTTG